MATRTSTTTVSPSADAQYLAAKAAQTVAVQRHADALAAVTTATEHEAALNDRLLSGDSTVTGLDLMAATGDVSRMGMLALAAEAVVSAADAALAPLVAERWASAVAVIVDPETQIKANEKAAKAIAAALAELAEVSASQERTIKAAIADAKAAGVKNFIGITSGFGLGKVTLGSGSTMVDVILFDGDPIETADVVEFVREALVNGAEGAGFAVDGEYGRARVRTVESASW
ncbi:hypothetical protein [Pengzhenrongella sicca]|uniref:Uncharacterized protein n=1 Tax=Pengzhenrongella sicca TaxID=2819238 RepID=A0A8A4ZGB0_9MICO|nr:hypothetical protein [Pengzhenrongella sicca]QTE30431.1 hypothetical protein J4E96_05425 [Pengzhenrongella sicca]